MEINQDTYDNCCRENLECPYGPLGDGQCPNGHYHTHYKCGQYSSIDGNFCITMRSGHTYARATLENLKKAFDNGDTPHMTHEFLSAQLTLYDVCPMRHRDEMIVQLKWLVNNTEGLSSVPNALMKLDLAWRKTRILQMVHGGMPIPVVLAMELDPMEWQFVLPGIEYNPNNHRWKLDVAAFNFILADLFNGYVL